MERSVNVNADLPVIEPEDLEMEDPIPVGAEAGSLGPCLYLGPAGERCSRPALEGSFCARHQPQGSTHLSSRQISQRSVAILGLLAVLWPVLADLVRELIRLLR